MSIRKRGSFTQNVVQATDYGVKPDPRETERRVMVGKGRELPKLGANALGEVLSFLALPELIEAQEVSKEWRNAVMEGRGLWRKVDVYQDWNQKDRARNMTGNAFLSRVLEFAEDLTLLPSSLISSHSPSCHVMEHEKRIMTEGGWLAPNLRILKLPFEYVRPDFFPRLVSKFPLLESLVVEGNLPMRNYTVEICHPNLKSLKFYGCLPLDLIVNCPALTHLSSLGQLDTRVEGGTNFEILYPPSLLCPRLQSLHLTHFHCTIGVLKAVVLCVRIYPSDIASLEAYVTDECPFTDFTHFKALRVLKVRDCRRGITITTSAWPLLESLRLKGTHFAGDVEVAHVGLKSLEICDANGILSPLLSCTSLEHLELTCGLIEARCVQRLDQLCPNLKRVEIGLYSGEHQTEEWWRNEDGADGPLDMVHERLEELRLRNFSRGSVACSNLKKLVMKWEVSWIANPGFPTLECPRLKFLELSNYDYVFMPGILSALPSLQSLRCECDCDDPKDAVLEHPNIRDVVFDTTRRSTHPVGTGCILKKVSLNMPSLVQVEVLESRLPS